MYDKFYLYRFIDINDEIIYIGRTNDIKRRILKEHFTTKTHLPKECYLETVKVEYVEIDNESEEVAYEAILINQSRPKYNIQFKDKGEFDCEVPVFNWIDFPWECEGQIDLLKKYKEDTTSLLDITLDIFDKMVAGNLYRCIRTGYKDIDDRLIISQTSLVLLAGISGEYKTQYALSIAIRNSIEDKKVLYVNLKNDSQDLVYRIFSMETFLDPSNIIDVTLNDQEWENLVSVVKQMENENLSFYNRSECGTDIEQICKVIKENDYDLVIIDDLNTVECHDSTYDVDKMARVMKRLKGLTIEMKIPIIAIYCLNVSNIEKRVDKRPILSDLRYTSMVSLSDTIQFLYKNKREFNDEGDDSLEVITVKNQFGNNDTVQTVKLVCFKGCLGSFPEP